jgi:CheY-like chemotaxis protein
VHVNLAAGLGWVRIDPGQLEQVLVNLAINARDAMPKGGRLVIEGSNVELDQVYTASHPQSAAGRYVLLSISDTGQGMSVEVKRRIFEPFFTTKPAGQGTGMGLAMVYGIVKNHGGSVELTSEVGRGSRFCIWLPATERGPTAISRPPLPVAGSGRILVVDDEDLVRATAERLLTGIGYKVQTARDGVEALAKVQAQPGDFDLVLLDLGMPRMDGLTCLRALKQHAPSVRMLVSTGYALDGATEQALAEGACGCLPKPYLLTELAEAVRQALHPPPASGSPTSL